MTPPEGPIADGEILPPPNPGTTTRQSPAESRRGIALAIATRLAGAHKLPDALLARLDGPPDDAVAAAAPDAGAPLAQATKRAYQRDWDGFADWCRSKGADPDDLPIHPMLLAVWLASLVPMIARSALNARIAAIAYEHRRRGHPWVAGHPSIREALGEIGRRDGKPVRPAAALTTVAIGQLIATCADDLSGRRDRALFLVGHAGGFRRSELVGIDFVHLRFEASGVMIRLPRGKPGQDGQGEDVTLPRRRGDDTCPVRALEHWLARAGINRGPVFRNVTTHRTLEGRLSADGVRKILRRRAALAGLTVPDSERLSPHSLRAGFIAEAFLAAAPDEPVAAQTRHADRSTLRPHRRRANTSAGDPASAGSTAERA
jgi:integrase